MCGWPVGDREADLLLKYLDQLNKWNAAYNLTAIRDAEEQMVMHLFDCLAIVPHLNDQLQTGAVVLDVGSGGGLPGAVIAICSPGVQVHCVDAVGKKSAFVTLVKGALALPNLHAHHARVEAMSAPVDLPWATLVISRAFSSLPEFIKLTQHLRAPSGTWAAMKGVMPHEEVSALPSDCRVVQAISLKVPELKAERHLLMLTTD
jgi:16S rRNA (guanine527-N7)-methyltransferase